jgi:hypothetical protein
MSCDPQTLLNDFGGAQFASQTQNSKRALELALLCRIYQQGASGATTWGADGDNVVRPIGNVYYKDVFTGLYHLGIVTSEFTPGIPQFALGDTGYLFADIPD